MEHSIKVIKALIFLIAFGSLNLSAQTRSNVLNPKEDPRGLPELIICSQNLENYGFLNSVKRRVAKATAESLEYKSIDLVKRFLKRKCDVIAVQEIVAKNQAIGKQVLEKLAQLLKMQTNRIFDVRVGQSNDKNLRTGFLVARDRATVLGMLSYARVELPKLSEEQKPRLFSRGPLELQLNVKGRKGSYSKVVTIINMHFKSKRSTRYDPAGLEWETFRMEMAEALRRVILNRHEHSFTSGETLLVVLGDRNSHFDSASAKILEGVITLRHFQEPGICRLSKRGVPLCQGGNALPQRLFSVLTLDKETRLQPGTYSYKGVYSWLDDILMPAESLPFAWAKYGKEGDYESGVLYQPVDASDHAMVWVALNW